MKKTLIILIMALPFLTLVGCSKDDDKPADPVDLLPPATQTGANKVGCLLNGEAFLPKGGGLSGNRNCFYQFVDGGYYFGLQFTNKEGNVLRAINIFTKKSEIEEGKIYDLNIPRFPDNINGKGGAYNFYTSEPYTETYYSTTPEVTGELIINKLDFENNIVSGTFWFDAVNDDGEIVEIREGRFDMKFTR